MATTNETTSQFPASRCTEGCSTTGPSEPARDHDALLYIVVVLLFYAFSIVILMVKYIRREEQEAEMEHYYSEFVSRDRFKAPIFEIKRNMNKIMGTTLRVDMEGGEVLPGDFEGTLCINENTGSSKDIESGGVYVT